MKQAVKRVPPARMVDRIGLGVGWCWLEVKRQCCYDRTLTRLSPTRSTKLDEPKLGLATWYGDLVWRLGMAIWVGDLGWRRGMATWDGDVGLGPGSATWDGDVGWRRGMAT